MNNQNMVFCTLLQRKIEEVDCFNITMNAEDLAPDWCCLEEAMLVEGHKEICLNCVNHRE